MQSSGAGYLLLWFSYDANGAQQWFVGTGSADGPRIEFDPIVRASGGRFGEGFDPAEVVRTPEGGVTMSFASCTEGSVGWTRAPAGSRAVRRLTAPNEIACDDGPAGGGAESASGLPLP